MKDYYDDVMDVQFHFSVKMNEIAKWYNDTHDDSSVRLGASRGVTITWCDETGLHVGIEADTPCTLVHECIHAKNTIMERRGQRPDVLNDEWEAYYTSYIFRQFCRAVKPSWNREKKK